MIDHPSLLAQLMDAVADPTAATEVSGRYLFANAAFCSSVGLSLTELLTHTLESLPLPGDAEFRSSQPLVDADGAVVGTRWVTASARRRAERDLADQQALLRTVIDENPDAIVLMDWDGTFLLGNRQFARTLRTTPEGLIGKDVTDFGTSPEQAELQRQDGQGIILAGHTQRVFEERMDEATGRVRTYQSVKRPFLGPRGKRQLLAVLNDITDIRAALLRDREEADRARALADAANRAKSQFLANMSHEIRTPMNGVLGMIELLNHTALTSEQSEYTATIQSGTQTLLSVINDILDFSKIEAGKMDVERVVFDLPLLVSEVCGLLEHRVVANGLTLTRRLAAEVPTHVEGAPTRLRQVLLNLIANAEKFTERGGIVVEVGVLDPPTAGTINLRFAVQDTGVGVAAEHEGALFLPFSQVDNSSKRRFGGSGLGLAISRRVVEAMGGTIGYDPQPGGGSSFWFTVPLRVAHAGAAAAARPRPASPRTARTLDVLVVEDNATNLRYTLAVLARVGHRAEAATEGALAVQRLTERRFDVVLMDCQMPGMDGFQATAVIRDPTSLVLNHDTPIVAMTANAMSGDREACLAAGMNGYVAKPVSGATLIEAIDRAFGRPPEQA